MDNNQQRDISIYICNFQAHVESANVLIKFPCQYFLQWKTANGKKVVEGSSRPTAKNTLVQFKQTLQLVTEMIYDNSTSKFFKKDTMLNLNLISKSRQDQVKLIGRVTIDLAEIANKQQYQYSKGYKLSYCSVDADLTFSATLQSKRFTNMNPQDLDKSSFKQDMQYLSDYFSFYSCASNPKEGKFKRDLQKTQYEETSIGYTKNTHENVIDIPHNEYRHSKPFNQTFFMLNSPIVNRNKQYAKAARDKTVQSQRTSNIRSDFAIRSGSGNKQISNSRSTQLTNLLNPTGVRVKIDESHRESQEDTRVWEKEKQRFRGEIDGNRQKIEELERKILELCTNLQDSKRHLEHTEKQNRQKEEIIRHLKQSGEIQTLKKRVQSDQQKSGQQLQLKEYLQIEGKFEKLNKERDNEGTQWRAKEQIYKSQIQQFQSSIEMLRKQTDEFRKMWQEKKQHYQEKLNNNEGKLKQKQQKVVELNNKIEDLLKFKYQYEILKELNNEKDEKLKTAEKSLNGLKFQIEQINKNNYAEEIYKLKLQISQSNKNYEDLNVKYIKNQEEISKYKENYIKIQTAFEIQSKNYDSSKEKNNQNESLIYNLQKENIQIKNHLNNTLKNAQELNKSILNIHSEHAFLQKNLEELQKIHKKTSQDLLIAINEKEELHVLNERIKIEQDAKSKDFEQKIKKIETTIICAQQQKDKLFSAQKIRLQSFITQLQACKLQLQENINTLQNNFSELKLYDQSELKKREAIISSLQSAITDKQQIMKMYNSEIVTLKESNLQLTQTLSQMSAKERQLQENIIILEEQSHKILHILEQKEQLDKDIEQLDEKYKQTLAENEKFRQSMVIKQSKIEEHKKTLNQKNNVIEESKAIIDQLYSTINTHTEKILSLTQELSEKEEEQQNKTDQVNSIQRELQETKIAFASIQQELFESKQETTKMKQIIKEINERYEEHLKLEQKYHVEHNIIRQEKEELQILINKNSNQFAHYNEQLEERGSILQKQAENLYNQCFLIAQEKKHFEERYFNLQSENKRNLLTLEELRNLIAQLQRENNLINEDLNSKKCTIQELQKAVQKAQQTIHGQELKIIKLNEQFANLKVENNHLQQKVTNHQASLKMIQEQKDDLNEHLQHLREEIQQKQSQKLQSYNQLIEIDEQLQVEAAKSILEERRVIDLQKYEEVQQALFQNEQKVKNLEEKVQQLNLQIRNLVYELEKKDSKQLYQDFPQFQREQMTKIIDEQRKEIDRLEQQVKSKSNKNSIALQNRIKELETNIVELQSSFRMEIDRILNEQTPKEGTEGGLSIINEQMMEDDCFRSEKSVASLIATPNRVKVSFDQFEVLDLKQKLQLALEEKQHFEGLFQSSEEEKFNLMSSINQKEIELQETLRTKMLIALQNQDLRKMTQAAQNQLQSLSAEVQTLRNQVNFGTSIILPNEQSITRSEPIINNEYLHQIQNKDIQLQNLRVELEKSKQKEEQLIWTIKDLEMQLETVNDNLNLLNGSSMNSFLNITAKNEEEQEYEFRKTCLNTFQSQSGYNKQKLLQSLKRNEQLKQMAHNIIRSLKQRQKDGFEQQRLIKDLKSNRAIINSAVNNMNILKMEMICKKISPLFKEFLNIKVHASKFQATRHAQDANYENMFKNLLSFQQKLKEIKSLSQHDQFFENEY